MSYQVIARKWRPKLFDDLIGQDHVARTLSNSIQSNRIAHGYLFAGPRGVGKTSTARIFAKALNCPNVKDGQPCNTCSTCIEITNGNGIDVIEIDGASNNSVDNIRDLRENIRFTPTGGRYKIYIIDEVHMLSKGAFNALLKTLEEPPKHAVFIFATTEIHKVLPTILSRCQRFDFKRIPITAIVATLHKICEAESIQVDENGLIQVAKKADGSMRDAQSILDQLISFCGNQISSEDVRSVLGIINQELFFEISQAFIEKNTGKSFSIVESLFQDGFDLTEVIHGLEEHMRHLLVCISTQKADLIDTADDYKQQFLQQAKSYKQMDILRIIEILQKTEQLIRSGNHPRIKLELAFAKICQMDKSVEINEVLNMLGSEKKKPETELIDTKRSESTEPNTFPIKPAIHQPSVTAAEPPIVDKITLVKDLPEQQNQTQTVQVKNSVTSEKNDVVKPEIPALDTNESKESQPIDHAITTAVYDRSDIEQEIESQAELASTVLIDIGMDEQQKIEDDITNLTDATEIVQSPEKIVEISTEAEIDDLRKHWDELIAEFKIKKPTLAACLGQSHLKEINDGRITVIFDDTPAGKFNLNTFIMNTEFIKTSLSDRISRQLRFTTSLENFDQTGIELKTQDLSTVVDRLRKKDALVNNAMELFALEAISFGSKK